MPAGTFKCFRIEGESDWINTLAGGGFEYVLTEKWWITNCYCPDVRYIGKSRSERYIGRNNFLKKPAYRSADHAQTRDQCRCVLPLESKYGGAGVPELKRLRELEAENAKLKRMYADWALENTAIIFCPSIWPRPRNPWRMPVMPWLLIVAVES